MTTIILSRDSHHGVDHYEVNSPHHPDDMANNVRLVLTHSATDPQWTPEALKRTCAKLHDNGDDVTIKVGKQKMRLDYSEIQELRMLLDLYNKIGENYSERYFKETDFKEEN